jgi:hypothetical protein
MTPSFGETCSTAVWLDGVIAAPVSCCCRQPAALAASLLLLLPPWFGHWHLVAICLIARQELQQQYGPKTHHG